MAEMDYNQDAALIRATQERHEKALEGLCEAYNHIAVDVATLKVKVALWSAAGAAVATVLVHFLLGVSVK